MPDLLEPGDAVPFLTPAWCEMANDEAAGLPAVSGASATFEVSIRRPAGVTTVFTARVTDGRIVYRMGPDPGADLHTEFEEEDYKALLLRELDAMTAFARGRVKVTGDLEAMVRIAPLMDAPAYRRYVEDEDN